MRTEKSPARIACSACSNSCISVGDLPLRRTALSVSTASADSTSEPAALPLPSRVCVLAAIKVLHLLYGANRHLAGRPRGESFRHESAEPANSASQSQRNKSRLFQYDLDRPARLVLTAALPPGVTWMATNLPNAERPSPFPVA